MEAEGNGGEVWDVGSLRHMLEEEEERENNG